MKSYNINTGGRVNPLTNDLNWRKKAQELIERNKPLPSAKESALERELWNQVSGKPSNDCSVSPKLATDYSAFRASQDRESILEQQLLSQISGV